MSLVLRYAARSDRGLVRTNNEDSVYAGARLLALADGMGGHAAGEVASQLMIAALAPLDDDDPGSDLLGKLAQATADGNASIAEHVAHDPELDGMGTTLTAMLFAGSRLGLVHVGDSRAYLLRESALTQITRDDTFVQSLVDQGKITAEQAHSHPQRSLIMRALTGAEVEPTLAMREAHIGDRYLICSDGLSDVVSDETIETTMATGTVAECAERLVELALRSGGPDNVTVVIADVIDLDYGDSHPIVGGAASGADDDEPTPDTAAGRAAAIGRRAAPKRVVPAAQPDELTSAASESKRGRRIAWIAVPIVVLVVLVVAGGFLARSIINSSYYVATDGEQVALIQGVPSSVFGRPLHNTHELACLADDGTSRFVADDAVPAGCHVLEVDDLMPSAREQVRSGLPSGSYDDVRDQLTRLVQGSVLPVCAQDPAQPNPADVPGITCRTVA